MSAGLALQGDLRLPGVARDPKHAGAVVAGSRENAEALHGPVDVVVLVVGLGKGLEPCGAGPVKNHPHLVSGPVQLLGLKQAVQRTGQFLRAGVNQHSELHDSVPLHDCNCSTGGRTGSVIWLTLRPGATFTA